MDENFEAHWHCFNGINYGSHVTHEKRGFIFFYIEKLAFLCYKMG
jgi:dynein light chain LC8-type